MRYVMELVFTKMHGLGNDFVVADVRRDDPGGWENLSKRLGHRRFGVGCDQVILIREGEKTRFAMDIYNSDGSRVEMCGNGIRCFAKYLKDVGELDSDTVEVETMAGLQICRFAGDLVEVDMGEPELEGRKIPVDMDGHVRDERLKIDDNLDVRITCVSMGNPHAVIFVDEVESFPIEKIGPLVENHPFFPNRINVEFVQVLNRERVQMRVWERGAGVTMACGTGACATGVASFWMGHTGREVEVMLDGGPLKINWDSDTEHVFMTGPAATSFEGRFPI